MSARAGPSGLGLRDEVAEFNGRPTTGSRWVIFIHGFNTGANEGREQASALFGETNVAGRFERLAYLWPSAPAGLGALSRFTYPMVIEPAAQAGRLLGEYLTRRGCTDAILVGHSLGALVAVEAANRWKLLHGEPSALVLTGAAVPASELDIVGQFGVPMAVREVVLHSHHDLVLRSVFEVGQKLTHPFSKMSTAVGLNGDPEHRTWERMDCGRFDHRYWKHPETAEALSAVIYGVALPYVRRPRRRGVPSRELGFA